MKIDQAEKDEFVLQCSLKELVILNNALNNIPEAVDEIEYTTLIGATKADTTALLATIHAALESSRS